MADNIDVTPGTGATVATKDVSSVEYQRVLVYSEQARLVDASSGLSTSTTNYTAGDQVGAIQSIASAFRTGFTYGTITGVMLMDEGDVCPTTAGYDIYLWYQSVTLAADNAAGPGHSDADGIYLVNKIEMPAFRDEGNLRTSTWSGAVDVFSADTTLYYSYVTRGDHNFFAATDDLYIVISMRQG